MPLTYSLHKIYEDSRFSFSPDAYSRFKFGDNAAAREFGAGLAEGFIKDFLERSPISEQIVVISSPYSFIPTATFAMKNYFVYRINRWLAENNLPVVQEAKVHRTVTYKEDYGELSAEDRIRLIGNDSFHIDREFVKGKTLLFLDDIRITGSHEKMILKMAGEYQLNNDMHLLYFAELADNTLNPRIENFLNYHCVKNIFDLNAIINSGDFAINTRIVKYLLNSPATDFRCFSDTQSVDFLTELYNMALGNGYHTIEAYQANLLFLKDYLYSTHLKYVQYGN